MPLSTSPQVVLDKFWANKVDSVDQGLVELRQQLNAIDEIPQHIIFVSAGEVKPLLNPDIAEFCQSIHDDFSGEIDFISAACTSLHASILHFNHSGANSCLVLLLELDEPIQQGCLDSLGIGRPNEHKNELQSANDGLSVKNSVGFCLLRKKVPLAQDLVIAQCHIFSQPKGIPGMQQLLKQLVPYLKHIKSSAKVVAFDISSAWSTQLKLALTHHLKQRAHSISWLASFETDHHHYLSLKPIFELQNYYQHLDQHALSLLTLGGGGRVGYLTISTQHRHISRIDTASYDDCNLAQDAAAFAHSINVSQYSTSDYHAMVKANLKYPRLQYRGLNNHYFRWQYRGFSHAGIKQ